MRVLYVFLVCAYVVTANAFKVGSLCKNPQCNHHASTSPLIVQSLCKLEVDDEYSANGVFLSRDKVLTVAFILYKSQESITKPIPAERLKILLPSSAAISAYNEYKVNRSIIPDAYKYPSYQYNFAILILKDNVKLPNYSNYPIINEHQGEDNRQYDLIGFYGHSVIKDIIMTHPADSKCGIYFEENTPSYTVKVNYNYNFCGKRSCFKITPLDGGIPVVSENMIIGMYLAGINKPMVCVFERLSKYQGFIKNVLEGTYQEQRSNPSSSNPWLKRLSEKRQLDK